MYFDPKVGPFYYQQQVQESFKPETEEWKPETTHDELNPEVGEWRPEEDDSSDSEVEEILSKTPELKYPSEEMFSNLRYVPISQKLN